METKKIDYLGLVISGISFIALGISLLDFTPKFSGPALIGIGVIFLLITLEKILRKNK